MDGRFCAGCAVRGGCFSFPGCMDGWMDGRETMNIFLLLWDSLGPVARPGFVSVWFARGMDLSMAGVPSIFLLLFFFSSFPGQTKGRAACVRFFCRSFLYGYWTSMGGVVVRGEGRWPFFSRLVAVSGALAGPETLAVFGGTLPALSGAGRASRHWLGACVGFFGVVGF